MGNGQLRVRNDGNGQLWVGNEENKDKRWDKKIRYARPKI